jgi:hypothetical protein
MATPPLQNVFTLKIQHILNLRQVDVNLTRWTRISATGAAAPAARGDTARGGGRGASANPAVGPGVVILFHRTTENAARSILADGFRNARGSYGMEGIVLEGVFVSDRPVDCNEGAKGDVLLRIELAQSESEIVDCEIVEDGKPWREWILPAELLNARRISRA